MGVGAWYLTLCLVSMVGSVMLDEVQRMSHCCIHEKELFGKVKHVSVRVNRDRHPLVIVVRHMYPVVKGCESA